MVVETSGNIVSKDYNSVKGVAIGENYKARLPIPIDCLEAIEAAVYVYSRDSADEDSIYLMSHGYVWGYVIFKLKGNYLTRSC